MAAKSIEDLEDAFAVDDELSVADEGKVVIVVLVVFIHPEHQLEAALIVRRSGLEGVVRGLEQVDVGASQMVD